MTALRDHFHELSVGARGSDTDRWLRVLRDTGLEILAEADSPASRAQAVDLSLGAYKMRLAQRLDLLPLTLLPTIFRRYPSRTLFLSSMST